MRSRIWILPSLVTLANLVCGFAAIGIATYGELELAETLRWRGLDAFALASLFILAALVFDALDGKIARMANLTSEFGAQLDSLCDMVSFGLAPAYLVFLTALNKDLFQHDRYAWVCAALFIICAALRLARFNVQPRSDHKGHRFFQGLPTPAAGGLLASMLLVDSSLGMPVSPSAALLPFVTVILAGLMVSYFPYIHLANHLFKERGSFRYLVVVVLVVLAFLAVAQYYEYILLAGFGLYCLSGPAWGAYRRFVLHLTVGIPEEPADADGEATDDSGPDEGL